MRKLLEHLNASRMVEMRKRAVLTVIDLLFNQNLSHKEVKEYARVRHENADELLTALSWLCFNGYAQYETFNKEARYYLIRSAL